ncbi:MAG TPA: phenylalanine--tRNA ligase subunit alpha, partial [Bacteroidales bacterium]|nr:phenylalanine--tRNA ligase subunit alpha [Bacteroidales bacterium]
MKSKIDLLLNEINGLIAKSPEEVEQIRLKYLSKKGLVSVLFEEFKSVDPDRKREIGSLLNNLKNAAQDKINQLRTAFENLTDVQSVPEDLTRPAERLEPGTRHPLSIVRNRIIEIFGHIGFTVAEGPEIEDDWHNFTALNFAPDHPARDMQDTFFIVKDPDIMLRTHTSSVQIRTMES